MLLFELINVEKTFANIGDKLTSRLNNDESAEIQDAKQFIQWVADDVDPTPNQKFTMWIISKYLKGGIRKYEDFARANEYLTIFDKHKQKMEIKDINQIKTLSQLGEITLPFKDAQSGKEKKKGMEQGFYDSNAAKLIFNSDRLKIVSLKTHQASCYFGKNTQWCTTSNKPAGEGTFNSYLLRGPLYVILDKKNNRRFQMQPTRKSLELMDETDKPVSKRKFFEKYPEVLDTFFPFIKTKYGFNLYKIPNSDNLLFLGKTKTFVGGKNLAQQLEGPEIQITLPPNLQRHGPGWRKPLKQGLERMPKVSARAMLNNMKYWHSGWDQDSTPGRKRYPPTKESRTRSPWKSRVDYIPWQRNGVNLKIKWYEIIGILTITTDWGEAVLKWSYYAHGKDKRGNEYWMIREQGSRTGWLNITSRFKEAE